jgi:hypothetical protein
MRRAIAVALEQMKRYALRGLASDARHTAQRIYQTNK